MKTDLTKHIEQEDGKTRAESIKEWEKAWENSRYLLRPLREMLREQLQSIEIVKEPDFDCPNHYAKLMYREGIKKKIQDLIDLMPKSLDN